MKRFYFTTFIAALCMLFIPRVVRAQHAYIPIPEDSAFWISVEEDWNEDNEPPGQGHTFSYMIYYTDGVDTIVNGKQYFGYNVDYPPLPSYGSLPAYYESWYRQDTIAKKIWRVQNKIGPLEYLFYDFSLQKGDTITDTTHFIFHHREPYKFWVADIDSVYFPDGTWRYRWFIHSNFGPDWGLPPAEVVQIEGMGYTTDLDHDPLYAYDPFIGYTYNLTCFRHNDLWLYTTPNPWNADCDTLFDHYILDVGIHDPPVRELNLPLLYPNPVRGGAKLTLSTLAGPADEMHTIHAYNVTGKLVLGKTLMPGQELTLPDISPGLYFFIVENKKQKTVYKQKIRIQ